MRYGQPQVPGFTIIKQLGKGSYGTVYKVKRVSDGNSYALKMVDLTSMNQRQREEAVNEIRIMASITSPFIIGFHEATIQDHKLCIVTDYAKLGDLSNLIARRKLKRRPFKEDVIWRFMLQVLEGLRVLHDRGIVHRDLKSANILLSAPDLFKIGDLGISTVLQQRQLAKTQIGTPMYLAPEVWKKRPYNSKCDIWSLGVLLYEMATFTYPFNARNARDLSVKVCSSKAPPMKVDYSRDLTRVIQLMLTHNPVQRPSVHELLAMPCIQEKMSLIQPFIDAVKHSEARLLDTIRVPRNLQLVNLPKPRYSYEDEMAPLDERVHVKGKVCPTKLSLASTRELQMIVDNDCWSPNKPNQLIREKEKEPAREPVKPRVVSKAKQVKQDPLQVIRHYQIQPNYRPKPPAPAQKGDARRNPRQGRITPPEERPGEHRAPRMRARNRQPLVIW